MNCHKNGSQLYVQYSIHNCMQCIVLKTIKHISQLSFPQHFIHPQINLYQKLYDYTYFLKPADHSQSTGVLQCCLENTNILLCLSFRPPPASTPWVCQCSPLVQLFFPFPLKIFGSDNPLECVPLFFLYCLH